MALRLSYGSPQFPRLDIGLSPSGQADAVNDVVALDKLLGSRRQFLDFFRQLALGDFLSTTPWICLLDVSKLRACLDALRIVCPASPTRHLPILVATLSGRLP